MTTTPEILSAARELGKLIAEHASAKKFEDSVRKLQADLDAQRLFNDFNRHAAKIGEKEAAGKPIEVEDKRQLEKLQTAIARNAVLRDFQMAQMDYLDLMRKIDEAMAESGPEANLQAPAPGSPGSPGAAPVPGPSRPA